MFKGRYKRRNHLKNIYIYNKIFCVHGHGLRVCKIEIQSIDVLSSSSSLVVVIFFFIFYYKTLKRSAIHLNALCP